MSKDDEKCVQMRKDREQISKLADQIRKEAEEKRK